MRKFVLMAIPILLVCSVSAHEEDWEAAIGEVRDALEESMSEVRKLQGKLHDQNVDFEAIYQPPNRAALGIFLETNNDQDLMVRDFAPRSHAKEQGVQKGDVLIGINDQDLTGTNATIETLLDHLKSVEPGSEVTLEIQRGDDSVSLNVETLAMPEAMGWLGFHRESRGQPPISGFRELERWPRAEIWLDRERIPRAPGRDRHHRQGDVQITDLNEDLAAYFNADSGVLVLEADESSELKAGDVIVSIGDQEVANTESLYELLHDSEGTVKVMRKKKSIELSLEDTLDGLQLERDVTIISRQRRGHRDRFEW